MYDSDCRGETGYGFCLSSLLPDGGQSGYGTGDCVADCSMVIDDAWCNGEPLHGPVDGGAHCDTFSYDNASGIPVVRYLCKTGCATNADCKPGYQCVGYGSSVGVCDPRCDNVGAAETCSQGACLSSWGCLDFAVCNAVTNYCD
jgi:hypothetical protein